MGVVAEWGWIISLSYPLNPTQCHSAPFRRAARQNLRPFSHNTHMTLSSILRWPPPDGRPVGKCQTTSRALPSLEICQHQVACSIWRSIISRTCWIYNLCGSIRICKNFWYWSLCRSIKVLINKGLCGSKWINFDWSKFMRIDPQRSLFIRILDQSQ